jgi:1-acyl-sn-glycerol-3-phosphate acyltransferase
MKQLVILKEDIFDDDLKAGPMGLVDSLDKDKVDVLFFNITDFKNKKAETKRLNNIDISKLMRIEDFYTQNRFKSDSIWLKILLLFYFPIGISLIVVRLAFLLIFLILAFIFPFSFFRSHKFIKFLTIGIFWFFKFDNKEELGKSDANIIVSNHVTLMDYLAHIFFKDVFILANPVNGRDILSRIFSPIMGGNLIELKKGETPIALSQRIKNFLGHTKKLYIYPEGTIFDGSFLHHFHSFAFSLGNSVLPITIKVKSIFPICYYPFAKSQLVNVLWQLAMPYSIYCCKLLPTVYTEENENREEFAYRVQQLMADDLDVMATCISNKHKKLYTKNREFYREFIEEN